MTSEGGGRRQKRMGPAPFASFEDLSDELDSPDEKQTSVVRLPGIREDATPVTAEEPEIPDCAFAGISLIGRSTGTPAMSTPTPQGSVASTALSLQTPSTPRIDISRASSSSHHDSRDSTPERELFEGHDPAGVKLGLGFREEGALDLRSSTEELDFQDPHVKLKERCRAPSPVSKFQQDESTFGHQRKDSQSSEIGLLSISGRTSRLSSVGSQGSAHSRISNASHLSVISGQSGLSRSPSPHKMLLETSFCGTKPPVSAHANQQTGTKVDTEVLEQVLLSRKGDPREAILAEGIKIEKRTSSTPLATARTSRQPPEKPARKLADKAVVRNTVKSDVTITIDKPPPTNNRSEDNSNNVKPPPKTIIAESGIEYTYIPLKGPLPVDLHAESMSKQIKTKRETRSQRDARSQQSKDTSKGKHTKSKEKTKEKPKEIERKLKPTESPACQARKSSDEPQYIRIKLKPDHMYTNDPLAASSQAEHVQAAACETIQKPISLNLNDAAKKPAQSFTQIVTAEITVEQPSSNVASKLPEMPAKSLSNTPSASPKLSRHSSALKEPNVGSKSPSPALSRKSSFASIFRSKETIMSPDSPTGNLKKKGTSDGRNRSRSRSKSRDRDRSTESTDSKSKQKSVFSIFKPKKSSSTKTKSGPASPLNSTSPETIPSIEGIANVEFTFNSSEQNLPSKERKRYQEKHLQGDSIRIPLHSPTYYENKTLLQDVKSSSQDSQETVIEKCAAEVVVESQTSGSPRDSESNTLVQSSNKSDHSNRQSSTSSENIVFSTKLGSTNEIFTTKLPKEKHLKGYLEGKNDKEQITSSNGEEKKITPLKEENYIEKRISRENSNVSLSNKSNKLKSVESIQSEIGKRSSVMSTADDDRNSSESEKDSEQDFLRTKMGKEQKELTLQKSEEDIEPERKTLVLQDSFEDELPYIPTTLPLERSVAIPIVPVKQRGTFEMKTYPIDRPRSTTPINPSCLEDYCEDVVGSINAEVITKQVEKLKISLPNYDVHPEKSSKQKSPRRIASNTTNWFEFAEKGISTQRRPSLTAQDAADTPPPLPPKNQTPHKEWINFEEIPERRKHPKRIQTIPSRGGVVDVLSDPLNPAGENVIYNYVNPEDCKCECHEMASSRTMDRMDLEVLEDELPLLEDETAEDSAPVEKVENLVTPSGGGGKSDSLQITAADRRSTVSDSSIDLSTMSVEQSELPVDPALQVPFTSDLGVTSNRSSIVSQDETTSPDTGLPNAFPRVTS